MRSSFEDSRKRDPYHDRRDPKMLKRRLAYRPFWLNESSRHHHRMPFFDLRHWQHLAAGSTSPMTPRVAFNQINRFRVDSR